MAACAVAMLAGCGGGHRSAWPEPNLDAAATRATDGGIDVGNVSKLHVEWRFRIRAAPGESGSMTATPVIGNGLVYVEDLRSNVYALDLRTGRIVWRRLFDRPNPGPNGLALMDGRVFGVTDASLFALDAATGKVLWRRLLVSPTEQFVETAPLAADGRVFASTVGLPPGGKGALYAFDAGTGRFDWRFETVEHEWSIPSEAGGGGAWYPPTVSGGYVYWGTTNPYPYGGTRSHPNGGAYKGAALYTDSLLVLDEATGRLVWFDQVTPHDVRDYDFQVPPILVGRLVVGAGKAGRVIAWNRSTHRRVWAAKVGLHRNDSGLLPARPVSVCPGLLGGVETPMAYAHGVVFVPVVDLCMRGSSHGYVPLARVDVRAGTGELVALDAMTGRRLWRARLQEPDFGCATVADGVVFTSSFDGTLVGFDARDGARLVERRFPAGINACPAVVGDTLVLAAGVRLGARSRLEVDALSVR